MNTEQNNIRAEFFEQSEMLISIYDKHLNLIDANTAFLKTLRLNKQDIMGKNISEISPDCKPSGRYKIYEDIIATGKNYVTDQVRLHPSLGSIYIRLTAFRVGEGLGISSKEITDLIETIDDLETFIYKISHDIRSPISNTLGLIYLAERELKGNAQAELYLEMLKKQSERLDLIVRKLSETTAIRQSDKKTHMIDFEKEINHIIHTLSDTPGFGHVHFYTTISGNGDFFSDKKLLDIIFQNLLHNAILYRNEKNEHCTVNIAVTGQDNGVKITISDNGAGIAELVQKDVFKMFFRGSSASSGSGLGLYTVKQCVKKLSGQIAMESKKDMGTTFTIHLPSMTDQ